MPLQPVPLIASVDPARRLEACGEQPGNVCRFVIERTDNLFLAELADGLTGPPLRILLVVTGAWVLNKLVRRVVKRFGARIQGFAASGKGQRLREKTPSVFLATGEVNIRSAARAETVTTVLRSVASAIIWTFAVIYVLGALGLNLGPLLAGAGVAGVALGFGAQSLVRDFLSGIFMIIEDQFGVGDVVDIGEASGTVEQITLRVTRLRDLEGTVWHVPNGEIRRVGNMSQKWARAVLDIAVAPSADIDQVVNIISATAETVWDEALAKAAVLGRPEVLGGEDLGPDPTTIRVMGQTPPGAQWRIRRLLRVRIAAALAEAGIERPPGTFVRSG